MIGIISDIHGNYAALKAVLAKLDKMGVDDIVCLGDVAGYYCQINECCSALRERSILTLMGNHDAYLVNSAECKRSKSANVCLAYQKNIISEDNISWLASAPARMFFRQIDMVHGGWHDPLEEYVTPSETYFDKLEGRFFASGHTHVPVIWKSDRKTYCNPGSVGQPRDGDCRAAFATWDGTAFELHRQPYDVENIIKAMAAAGFTEYYFENLRRGSAIGGKVYN